MNLASAVILYPANECLTMYTMYEGDNCVGRSKSSHVSYETEESLLTAINHFNLQADTPIIRSIRHPRGSSIEVFAEEGFADAGSFFSEYLESPEGEESEEGDNREDTICTTFRFEGLTENGTVDKQLNRPMPQKSLQFIYKDCPPDVAQLHDYVVPE